MEKWSLGYALFKLEVQFAFWLSHRKITLIGKENIPYGRPMIFAPNHQNALMDPLAILCTTRTQPVWLARADIFTSSLVRSILRFLKILPVYRIRDGKNNLSKNDDIFNTAIRVLENKNVVGLFPEAAHSGKRQMLAHKKAVPRIAFLTESKNNFQLDSVIVPIGIYYSHYWFFNRSMIINYGKPIKLAKYRDQYYENEYKATLALRDEIYHELEKLVLNIRSKEHYENIEFLRSIWGKKYSQTKSLDTNKTINRFYSDIELVKKLEHEEAENPVEFGKLHETLDYYREELSANKLDEELIQNYQNRRVPNILNFFIALLLTPFLVVGSILFFLPFLWPRHYIQRKVKDDTFFSTFSFVAGLITHSLFVIVLLVALLIITKNIWLSITLIIASFIIGKIGFFNLQLWKQNIKLLQIIRLKIKHKQKFTNLLSLRKSCMDQSAKYLFKSE